MSELPLAEEFPQADDGVWMALVEKALKGADFDKTLLSHTYDGLNVKPLYTRGDETGADSAGIPGAAPFIRGFSAARGESPWDIRQLYASEKAELANAAILDDLEGGATGIALQVAAPGQGGLKLDSTDDLDRALHGVALDLAGVWLEAGHGAATAATALQEIWSKNGISDDTAIGGFGADPLGVMVRTGGHPLSLEQALGEMAELAERTHERFPKVTAVLVDARPYHGGGGSEAQELACLCATTVAYLRAMEDAGLSPPNALAQMEFALACDADLFANIAKLRAARALIARIADVSDANDALPGLRLHAMTSFRMFTRLDPHVNILRTTIASAAAALGGANSLTVLPFTYAIGQPDGFARRIARNIQIILQEESSLGAVLDPAGGSWYVEDFTRNLAARAWELFQDIEAQGGMAQALAKGSIQAMLAETANKRARDFSLGKEEMTGVSSFPDLGETTVEAEPHPLPDELDDPAITVEPVPLCRPAEPFEMLRAASDAFLKANGKRPQIVTVTLGKASDFSARASYAESFFAAGGIEAVTVIGSGAYNKSVTPIACICSSDEVYEVEGVEAAKALKDAGAENIYSVGRPADLREDLRQAGVDGFIHQGCDIIETLENTHDMLGLKPS
jgi:methylmalonyl-CoA mutase